MNEETNEPKEESTEEAPGQPGGTQPATVPGAENPESEEIKEEQSPNTE
ncbi:MAG: hypothetical protein JO360_07860 [Acidobacteria bacterium]|nr:hypothetical protein [Acidobacteriota bacterium]